MGSPATPITDPNEGWIDVPAASPAAPPAASAQDTNSGWTDVPDDKPSAPPAPPEKSVTDFLLHQTKDSLGRAAEGLGHSVIHPIQTLEGVGNLVAGTFKAAARGAGFEMPENESDQVARNFADYAANRWGGVDRIKEALYHDPVGMLMDFSTMLSGAGAVVGGASAVADVAGAARAAGTLGKVGEYASKAAEITNPMYLPSKATSWGIRRLITPKPLVAAPPPEVETHPPFNPKSGNFSGEEPFDLDAGKFTETPGGYKSPQPKPPEPSPPPLSGADQLRAEWGVKPGPPGQATYTPPPKAAPPPKPPPPQKPPPPPPEAAPPPKPAAPPARPAGWKGIAGPLAGYGVTGVALEYLTHHLLGTWGAGVLTTGAIKMLPQLLKSEAGQQMLTRIGPGSNVAKVAGVARDLVPALNTLYQSQLQQQSMGQSSVLDQRAEGGLISPELARLQRERLPGIYDMLQRKY